MQGVRHPIALKPSPLLLCPTLSPPHLTSLPPLVKNTPPTCTAVQLILQRVFDLILDVMGDVVAVRDVPDARERDGLAELA